MARLHGKDADVKVANVYSGQILLGITNWSIDYKCAADETTGMDSGGAKEFLAGLTEWSGSFNGYYDSTVGKVTPGAGGTGTFYLVGPSGTNYAGAIIITSVKVEAPVDGIIKLSCDFQGTGALT